jgi:hypothetical protein
MTMRRRQIATTTNGASHAKNAIVLDAGPIAALDAKIARLRTELVAAISERRRLYDDYMGHLDREYARVGL